MILFNIILVLQASCPPKKKKAIPIPTYEVWMAF